MCEARSPEETCRVSGEAQAFTRVSEPALFASAQRAASHLGLAQCALEALAVVHRQRGLGREVGWWVRAWEVAGAPLWP